MTFFVDLVEYSLVQPGNPGALNPESIIYYVHDIVLDYLKDTISVDKQVKENNIIVVKSNSACC